MPFNTPSLPDLIAQGRAGMAARVPGADLSLRRSVLATLSDLTAQTVYPEYRYLGSLILQAFASTATGSYLDRIGGEYALPRQAAAASAGTLRFAGNSGLPIPAGAVLQTTDGAVQVATQAAAATAGGIADVAVVAGTPGAIGNLAPGTPLALLVGIAGLAPTAAVLADANGNGLTGGLDAETDDAYRARILARKRQPPQGGTAPDYIQWALKTPGVTRAWAFPRNRGLGSCDVAFVMDGRADIIPLAADVAAAQATLDLYRPVTADCIAFAPVGDPLGVTIANLSVARGAALATVQAGIAAAVAALVAAKAQVAGGAFIDPATGDLTPATGTLFLAALSDAVTQAGGVASFDLAAPAADVTPARGHIVTLAGVGFA